MTEETESRRRLREHFDDDHDRVAYGVSTFPAGSGGITTTTAEPASGDDVYRDILAMARRLADAGVGTPYTVYGLDVGGGPDQTPVTFQHNGDVITVYIDPWMSHAKNLDLFSPPLEPKEVIKRDKPWVALNRKPWERKR